MYTVHNGNFQEIIERVRHGEVIYLLVIGTTDTSLIPGITIAGASPELTHYTPIADAEYLLLGSCKSISTIPVTPDGKPTPAVISRACLNILKIPTMIVNAGCRIKPKIPYIDLNGEPGRDIRTGKALDVEVVEEILTDGKILGRELSKKFDVLIIGESIPAGTTTAMAFLVGLGYNAWGRVSSASPINPKELKIMIVKEALRNVELNSKDPVTVVSKVGDPVIIGISSIVLGFLENNGSVVLAGGTQMIAILAFLKHYVNLKDIQRRLAICTTRWIVNDKSADMIGLAREVYEDITIVSANLNFKDMPYPGLKAYEEGFVKEGVGAGGLTVITLVRGYGLDTIYREVIKEYEELLRKGKLK